MLYYGQLARRWAHQLYTLLAFCTSVQEFSRRYVNILQVNIFPNEKTFALRYQTTDMLETILRQGVLGEDDIREEFPKNLKLLSWRPAIVCETCLFSLEKDMRARAFISWIPKGLLK
ncbi:uncharacterized protein LOC141676508 isoform X4 [Apium graveolens]|uniref:uncharacterized protein LOC141676508 isoform X4 n=1 Tax=Apium graveolens TaxID=4045 RepID=UPI003D78E60B